MACGKFLNVSLVFEGRCPYRKGESPEISVFGQMGSKEIEPVSRLTSVGPDSSSRLENAMSVLFVPRIYPGEDPSG